LTTDVSNEGARKILSQGDWPTVYASCWFTKAEKNYSVVKKEIAVTVWGIKYLNHICMVGHSRL
jgi:hypothetical protein